MAADTLRERLETLVEEIDHDIPILQASKSIKHRTAAGTLRGVRAKIIDILAESEPPSLGMMDHEFAPCSDQTCKKCHRNVGGMACGQPRSAHEPAL